MMRPNIEAIEQRLAALEAYRIRMRELTEIGGDATQAEVNEWARLFDLPTTIADEMCEAMPDLLAYVKTLEALARELAGDASDWWDYDGESDWGRCRHCYAHTPERRQRVDKLVHKPDCPIALMESLGLSERGNYG